MSIRSSSPSTSTVRGQFHEPDDELPPFAVPHPEYYLEDGNLVIQVENTLFRVFRSTFTRHSAFFKDLFSLPGPVGTAEGLDDDNPLQFSGISVVEFERLLWVLYPPRYGVHRARTTSEWTSILSLATRWDFTDIRTLAIREIQSLDISPIDKVVLAQEFDIGGHWLLGAYIALCERAEPLLISEGTRLGLETAMRVAQLREQLRSSSRKSSRMGGYHTLTQSAAMRHGAGATINAYMTVAVKPPRTERLQWGIDRSFLSGSPVVPSARKPSQKVGMKKGPTAIPGPARLIAEAFGIDLSR
ncbi:hypothetical protein GSI_04436 [Ganoderma sinense ZZ0214-1]|uniref:BTB domain-containing protein n=1 Tax=Ganoderma sinense ZZ0214-1 TaxID=1077348 RepID=A0A2G8SJ85_9APHY|nr:hypothetical protein GSI_04436 [Ganoderma sinense ZZ0214-1]